MSNDNTKDLTVKRGRVKKTITDFGKFLDGINRDNITDVIQAQVKVRLDIVLSKRDEYIELHHKICDITGIEDDTDLEMFETSYYNYVSIATVIIDNFEVQHNKKSSMGTPPSANFDAASDSASTALSGEIRDEITISKIQLPTISLPTFSGKADEWLDFKDMYESLIHDNTTLNNAKKLYYLRGALQGDARLVLQGIKTSADNYDAAWACLCDRYQNKRMLVQNHLNAIYSIKPLKYECPSALRALLDQVSSHLRALKNLEQPVDSWDVIIIFLITKKLDPTTSREWENIQMKNAIKSLEELKEFIGNRADMLESLTNKSNNQNFAEKQKKSKYDKSFNISQIGYKCYFCNERHSIYQCQKFKEINVEERIKKAVELKLCQNCLRPNHAAKECDRSSCKFCHHKHNSLLHRKQNAPTNKGSTDQHNTSTVEQACHTATTGKGFTRVLLATAVVQAKNNIGQIKNMRVLLDDGSQVNLITTKAAQRLGISINKTSKPLGGIGDCITLVKGSCRLTLSSKFSNFELTLECLVMDNISQDLPQFTLNTSLINLPNDICLSDPNFSDSLPIDILIGAGHWPSLQVGKQIKLGPKLPVLRNTEFGWVLSGIVPVQQAQEIDNCYHIQNCELANALKRFWELEEVPASKVLSAEESYAENHFAKTITRDSSGRFVVAIPFKDDTSVLGESLTGAQRRFLSLERRLNANNELKLKYTKFIQEYLLLNHMSPTGASQVNLSRYYLPHHGVVNSASSTTKMRVVFDGSFVTSSGVSRNQIECVGPVVQNNLISILLRFRCHPIAISSDIVKMYRQVLVRPEDRHMQNILWRENSHNSIEAYELNTVTYGTASGSFLATRCLTEIAHHLENEDPSLSTIIKNDFYVDDLLTGANSVDEARSICKRIQTVLHSYGFPLQKWNSNNQLVFSDLENFKDNENVNLGSNEKTKTLGVYWYPKLDIFSYFISIFDQPELQVTKRNILSAISQIFDPLGLVGPSIIIPKMLLQVIWQLNLDWDAPVPREIAQQWINFKSDLINLNSLQIPRCIMLENPSNIQIHGYSDASERGLGACIYLRCTSTDTIQSRLICAKSKVSPLKTLSIPRLELCAALILSKLLRTVLDSFQVSADSIFLWTDSAIVLGWLKRQPNTLQTFVANRVSKIQTLTEQYQWSHIPSKDNPADLISRGVLPSDLLKANIWWYGPEWLQSNIRNWPSQVTPVIDLPEIKQHIQVTTCTTREALFQFERFSNYQRLINSMAYVLRFVNKMCRRTSNSSTLALTADELQQATTFLIKQAQYAKFSSEIRALSSSKNVKHSSKLLNLRPFLDDQGILRMQGRLQKSELDYNTRNPIILPSDHTFTKLLFSFEHVRLGHSGPQSLLFSVRERYWPIRGKTIARQTLHSCISCFRVKPKNNIPVMAPLPTSRVMPSPAFTIVGVDYAGPLLIKDRKGRGSKTSKCYLSIFICFSTKALHIEVVSDLTTNAFIAALRRFVARRGRPSVIWSDNGTNFVGANNELRKTINNLLADEQLRQIISLEHMTWKFIPSHSPHFGGLWESGVRGVKFHLKRIMRDQRMTFEELATVCTQIEAILNSRPLCVLSDDPNDPLPLTPSHFISARKLTSVPDENLAHVPINRLGRYQLLQKMVQGFWVRWRSEYLSTLQPTTKWRNGTLSLKVGDIVLIKDDKAPALHWPLGRVSDVFKGSDGTIRVAAVTVRGNQFRYNVHKLYPLPLQDAHCTSDHRNSLLPDGVLPRPGAC